MTNDIINDNLPIETDSIPTLKSILFSQNLQGKIKMEEKQKMCVEIIKETYKTAEELKSKGMIYGIITHEEKLRMDKFENIEYWISEVRHMRARSTLLQVIFRVKTHHKIC